MADICFSVENDGGSTFSGRCYSENLVSHLGIFQAFDQYDESNSCFPLLLSKSILGMPAAAQNSAFPIFWEGAAAFSLHAVTSRETIVFEFVSPLILSPKKKMYLSFETITFFQTNRARVWTDFACCMLFSCTRGWLSTGLCAASGALSGIFRAISKTRHVRLGI